MPESAAGDRCFVQRQDRGLQDVSTTGVDSRRLHHTPSVPVLRRRSQHPWAIKNLENPEHDSEYSC